MNQNGYLPDGPKRATLVTGATQPLPWELRDAVGTPVAAGVTAVRGFDPSAGLDVHTIDFSSVRATGHGFRLVAGGEQSFPFAIDRALYDRLWRDAIGFFYLQRSGIEILDALRPGYGRPAGHVSRFGDPGPNQGDLAVPCLPGAEGWEYPAGYTRDLTGGWYDAGDHGKYVVNAGITVYQLLSAYEWAPQALADDTLPIPERGNGVPSILCEVRWSLDWMLRMQVPDGVEMRIDGERFDAGGLVHHKLHDAAWTGLDTLPHEDPQPRYLHRPSTAATLNLAAAAAQGARVYARFDPAYARALLAAARQAWRAAAAHPEIYAAQAYTGGGPYDDTEVGDECYWAAAQLFLTTGEAEFAEAVLASPYHLGGDLADIWRPTGFDWRFTAAAGRLDLARVPSRLPGREDMIASVVAGADRYLAVQAGEPFGHPYHPEQYDWGSNHQVINNAIVIATAYDLTGEARYRDGALEAIDYVLGRNALNLSYVAGYGTRSSQHLHSRWYASARRLPPVPPGALAGGPNNRVQDPLARERCLGAAPQASYLDDAESWSTNELAINWNAALVWYAAWAADVGSS